MFAIAQNMFAIAQVQKFPCNHYLPCDLGTLVENNTSTLLWEDKYGK